MPGFRSRPLRQGPSRAPAGRGPAVGAQLDLRPVRDVRRVGGSASDFKVGRYDFHVRREGGAWVVDAFESRIKNPNRAHRATFEESTRSGALRAAQEWEHDHR